MNPWTGAKIFSRRTRVMAAPAGGAGEVSYFFTFLPVIPSLCLVALMVILDGATATAQTADRPTAPVHNVDGSFVREWLVLGPFPGRDIETDFLATAGGEANVRPKEGDTVTTKDGRQLVWTRLRSKFDVIDLEPVFGIQQWSVAYAYCELNSDEAIETDARSASYRPYPLWFNGRKVGQTSTRLARRDESAPVLPLRFNAGSNACLLKVQVDSRDHWVFSFQPLSPDRATAELHVTDPHGRPLSGTLIQVYDQGERVARLHTDASGEATVCLYPLAESYDLQLTSEELGTWLHAVALRPGERRRLEVALTNAVSISGRVVAMDGSPQNAIVVQALRVSDPPKAGQQALARRPDLTSEPRLKTDEYIRVQSLLPMPAFSETAHSDTNGNFRFVNLRPGEYRLRAHGAHGYVYPKGEKVPGPSQAILVEPGRTYGGTEFVFAEAKKGVWNRYPVRDGLADLKSGSIFRASDGMLWVGTHQRTLHAYDGVEFKMFSSPQSSANYFHAVKLDAKGTIWIGTDLGIGKMVNGQIQILPFSDTLPGKVVNSIETDPDGTVWFGSASGLCRFDGRQFVRWTPKEGAPGYDIGALLRTRNDGLWMSTSRSLARFDGRNFSEPVLLSGIRQPTVERLHEASDGAIWFCSPNSEGAAYRHDGRTLSRLGAEEGLISEQIYSITETSDGVLWFATPLSLSRFDGTTVLNYTREDGLNDTDVRDIFVDADDVLWCACNTGISRFDPKGFDRITIRDGLKNKMGRTPGVFAIEPDPKGGHLIGTEWGGVYHLDGQDRQLSTNAVLLADAYVRHIIRAVDGTLWFGTADGIYKQTDGRVARVLDRNWIIALNSDDQGQLWFGQGWIGGGVTRFNPKTGEETTWTRAQGLPDDSVWAVERGQDGGVWIGTGAGLAQFRNGAIENAGEKLGIPSDGVMSIREDADGTLWIGSGTDLHRLRGTNRVSIISTNSARVRGVWSTARTADGIRWMGTDKNGLLGYDGHAVTMIDKRDGLLGNQVFTVRPALDDSLLVGLIDSGLSRYRRTKSRPSVRLIEVKFEDRTFTEFANLPSTEIGKLVSVQYQEIDLKTHPDKRQFKYRVEGPSGQTLEAGITQNRRFEWKPKKGGAYTFEVQAIDRDLNYSKPARLTIRATVPWYANAWITVPGGGMFGGLAIWAFVARALYVRQRREAERLREQMLLQERQAREALEEKTQQLEVAKEAADTANRAKSTFLANMSHEIRTPLNAVLGYAQILQQDRSLGTDQRQSAATIERSGSHLLGLINEVLDLSKIEAGKMELSEKDFDLRELIRSLSEMFELRCRQKGLEWRVEFESKVQSPRSEVQGPKSEVGLTAESAELTTDRTGSAAGGKTGVSDPCPSAASVVSSSKPSLCSLRSLWLNPIPVRGDEVKLRQVLINLLGNAVKFTEQGEVVLRIESGNQLPVISDQSPTLGRNAPRNTDHCSLITFSVIDTGPGIPADLRDKIFEPFTQGEEGRQHGGTGLGLAIARRQIELMGGELRLDSELGRGSRFYFSLCFAPALAQEQESAAMLHKPARRLRAGTRVRALVADDVAENRDILGRVLRALGVDATDVPDGEQAFRELSSQPYDIAFLDIRMPGMTGYQVAQRISAEGGPNRAKLVAISASVLKHEQESYAEAGFDGFVPKPYRFDKIRECLEKHLGVTCEDVASETRQADRPDLVYDAGAELDPGLAARYPLRILLADDYPENRELGARILQGFGYSCERAGNGLEVIAALERQRFDLIFLDVHMPELDGLEAARRIRERWSDAERPWLVAMTASVERGDRETCLEAGMDDYVPKPVEIAGIRRVLEEAGKRRSSENRGPHLEEAPIAWARLELMLGKEDAVLREFLEKHCRRTAERIDAMRAALEAGNASDLEILSHGCKGTNANFGIRAVVRPAQELENAARSGDLSSGSRLLEELQQAFAQVQDALQARFPRRG
jgi:signal transduction histidine kinase/CheY-like chemotaxis protein/ligand-binding sensor domain-containing protein